MFVRNRRVFFFYSSLLECISGVLFFSQTGPTFCALCYTGGEQAGGEELEVRCPERQHAHSHPVPAEVEESSQVKWLGLLHSGGGGLGCCFVVGRFQEGLSGGRGGGYTHFMHNRSICTLNPRIPTMPERSMSGFHPAGRHCVRQAPSAVRHWASRMKGELHPSKNHL